MFDSLWPYFYKFDLGECGQEHVYPHWKACLGKVRDPVPVQSATLPLPVVSFHLIMEYTQVVS